MQFALQLCSRIMAEAACGNRQAVCLSDDEDDDYSTHSVFIKHCKNCAKIYTLCQNIHSVSNYTACEKFSCVGMTIWRVFDFIRNITSASFGHRGWR